MWEGWKLAFPAHFAQFRLAPPSVAGSARVAGGSLHTGRGSSLLLSPREPVKMAGFNFISFPWGKKAQTKLLHHHKALSPWLISQNRLSPAEALTERLLALTVTSEIFCMLLHQNANIKSEFCPKNTAINHIKN